MKKNDLTFIDLFSGCGGFSKGFEMAGHKCLLGVDHNADALESFRLNHKGSKTYLGDIRKLSKKKLEELIGTKQVDIVIGGPPCQGFSTVGRGQVQDERNILFKEFVRIVRLTNPRLFFLKMSQAYWQRRISLFCNLFLDPLSV